jgi:hypothetical protein
LKQFGQQHQLPRLSSSAIIPDINEPNCFLTYND